MTGPRNYYEAGKSQVAIVAVALVTLCASASFGAAQNRLSVGTLTCGPNARTSPTTDLRMRCHLVTSWGRVRGYAGIVTEFRSGADLRGGGIMRWSILMNSRPARRSFLTGRYIAASKAGELGPGADGKDLVGGADQSIILRPSSSTRGRSVVNLAPEVTALRIDYRRAARKREV
jgi:hypothetical protein